MKTATTPVTNPSVPGGSKIVYWTSASWSVTGGISNATTFCNAHKPPSPFDAINYQALLATTGAPASALVDQSANYYQPNGVFVGTGADVVNNHNYDGIFVHENGTYQGGEVSTFTGAASISAFATSADNCSDWTSSTLNAYGGETMTAGGLGSWFSSRFTFVCNAPHPLFCIQP